MTISPTTSAATAANPSSRIAGAPISWGVCEVPNWGQQLTPERVLAEMQDVGLSATELGPDGFLPADPQQMATVLKAHQLTAVGGFTVGAACVGCTAVAVLVAGAFVGVLVGTGFEVLPADFDQMEKSLAMHPWPVSYQPSLPNEMFTLRVPSATGTK